MNTIALNWTLGYTANAATAPAQFVPANVPGAAQADWAAATGMPDPRFGVNYEQYAWMEDVTWVYRAETDFALAQGEIATLVFKGIDYEYDIFMDGVLLCAGEGMFAPVLLDATRFAGGKHVLEVRIAPIPKADDSNGRSQARLSAKPAACYGWDWHPRLASVGIWEEAYLRIQPAHSIRSMEVSYALNEELTAAEVTAQLLLNGAGEVELALMDGEQVVCARTVSASGLTTVMLPVEQPKLWFPNGYGEQPLYTLRARALGENGEALDETTRRLGFRRVRMVMCDGAWELPMEMPKTRSDAPAQPMVNHVKVFGKGSNWVNAHLFPGQTSDELYTSLLTKAREANMNMLRVWGGGYVNKEKFFELCDELGILVWQEFPLACNEYPDDPHYLAVLEKEARAIVRRLRTHPCMALWCGGNELFNGWSRMTEQHHALRLLDKVCYEEDRFTPFNMTSPLNGMAHGNYIVFDHTCGKEAIEQLQEAHNTAYTEFGSPGAADPDYIKAHCTPEDYADFRPDNPVWRGHHAFEAWCPDSWVRTAEIEYFYGKMDDCDEMLRATQFLQAMNYKSLFEEMRRQAPYCAMALNWCYNEPWPTFANNSLLSFPDIEKPAYAAVRDALRPRIASLKVPKHLHWDGEDFTAELWLLNDCAEALPAQSVTAHYSLDGERFTDWGTLRSLEVAARKNLRIGSLSFPVPEGYCGHIHVKLCVAGHPEMDSHYVYPCRARHIVSHEGQLNV